MNDIFIHKIKQNTEDRDKRKKMLWLLKITTRHHLLLMKDTQTIVIIFEAKERGLITLLVRTYPFACSYPILIPVVRWI